MQYREIQEKESALFLSYFKETGLQYLPGGVASGFNKVERDVYPTRLLHIKGSRTVRAKEVPLSTTSLNIGDCFVLDAGLTLYVYNGKEANRAEKAKALELVTRLRDNERGGRAEIILVNEDDPHNAQFWQLLGGEVEVTATGEADDVVEQTAAKTTSLSRVSDESGSLKITPVNAPQGKLTKEMLDTKDVFVLDVGQEIFVWVGKKTTAGEKKAGMRLATTFLEKTRRPPSTPVTRVMEGGETAMFKVSQGGNTQTKFRIGLAPRLTSSSFYSCMYTVILQNMGSPGQGRLWLSRQ